MVGGHFAANIIAKKILNARYWWPTLLKDIHDFCKSCDNHHKIRGFKTKSLAKLVTTLPEEPFIGLIKLVGILTGKKYIFGNYKLCNQVGRSKDTRNQYCNSYNQIFV
jgi:hypothetical protein